MSPGQISTQDAYWPLALCILILVLVHWETNLCQHFHIFGIYITIRNWGFGNHITSVFAQFWLKSWLKIWRRKNAICIHYLTRPCLEIQSERGSRNTAARCDIDPALQLVAWPDDLKKPRATYVASTMPSRSTTLRSRSTTMRSRSTTTRAW